MNYSILDLVGNMGVFSIILGYFLLQINKINSEDLIYSLMNLIGAILIIISLVEEFNLSAFIIEIFWVVISLMGILKFLLLNRVQKN